MAPFGVWAFIFSVPVAVIGTGMRKFGTKQHTVYENALTNFTTTDSRSKLECGKKCALLTNCFGFYFDTTKKKCRLINQAVDASSPGSGHLIKLYEIKRCSSNTDGFCRDCKDLLENGFDESGEYSVNPDGSSPIRLVCDMTTSGGGWSVFQQRLDGTVDFYRYWNDYVNGFGNIRINGEFWLGLESIHKLTSLGSTRLYIELQAFDTTKVFAEYAQFSVSNVSTNYQNDVDGYSGTAGDSMSGMNDGYPFSTRDRDNSQPSCIHGVCPVTFKGAWWYSCCHESNLNGLYYHGVHTTWADGVNWFTFKGFYESIKTTKMMLRRN